MTESGDEGEVVVHDTEVCYLDNYIIQISIMFIQKIYKLKLQFKSSDVTCQYNLRITPGFYFYNYLRFSNYCTVMIKLVKNRSPQ